MSATHNCRRQQPHSCFIPTATTTTTTTGERQHQQRQRRPSLRSWPSSSSSSSSYRGVGAGTATPLSLGGMDDLDIDPLEEGPDPDAVLLQGEPEMLRQQQEEEEYDEELAAAAATTASAKKVWCGTAVCIFPGCGFMSQLDACVLPNSYHPETPCYCCRWYYGVWHTLGANQRLLRSGITAVVVVVCPSSLSLALIILYIHTIFQFQLPRFSFFFSSFFSSGSTFCFEWS